MSPASMRDLASRLRQLVRHDRGRRTLLRAPTDAPDDEGLSADPERVAHAFGASPLDARGRCLVIDRVREPHDAHGRRAVGTFAPVADAPIDLLDPRAGITPDWADRVVFFDLETTGLSGGAGTLAFLAGCGWFENGAFRVRQFLLSSPSGERAMLDALAAIFDEATLLVTFNGRTFDVPLVETRWAFHRQAAPIEAPPHVDMLPPARRLWGRDESLDRASCSLVALERSVLGFHRVGDVPGFEIPARYFHFLRTGDAGAVVDVLEHNRHDLVSLAGVMARALWLVREGPEASADPVEQLGLARLYERAGDRERARRAYALAVTAAERDVRLFALARLAALLGRLGRYEEAADAWQGVLDHARRYGAPPALEKRAVTALAVHHEHRARDLPTARRFAERLARHASGRARQEAAHRLGRLMRKLQRRSGPPDTLLS